MGKAIIMSESFSIKQGVRQGGILSTELYKIYNNTLLEQLEEARRGIYIGSIYCSAPMCADDVALLANTPTDLQIQINIAAEYSRIQRYKLQPSKSMVLPVLSKVPIETLQAIRPWEINGEHSNPPIGLQIDSNTGGVTTT
jgi:hypothetical protein